jgi:hypothetical protein
VKVFLWHVHGSWTTAFVQGHHRYLVPVVPDRGPDGRGRAMSWEWPDAVVEVTRKDAAAAEVDVVLLQRPQELEMAAAWLGGRRPGIDLPALYVEHSTPPGPVAGTRHPAADHPEIPVVHVTHFNRVFWDCGTAPVHVIEHGIVDPGLAYSGELDRAAAVVNEPVRRRRIAGVDLLPLLAGEMPVDVFGIGTRLDLPQWRLHQEMARRRVYLHAYRWTSLGLSLLEAMHLGMPVVAVASTEAPAAIPEGCGVVSTNLGVLAAAVQRLRDDGALGHEMGLRARAFALRRFGLARFLSEWDALLSEVRR